MAGKRSKWKADLWRQIKRDEKRQIREQIAALRRAIVEARSARRAALVRARSVCRQEKLAARQRATALRAQLLAELRERVKAARADAHHECKALFDAAKLIGDVLERDRTQLRAELAFRREMRRIEAANAAERKKIAGKGARAHERLRESDDEVEGNIPPELVGLWRRIKGQIRTERRRTRTEAFLEWAEAHPAEVLAATADEADVRLAELIAEREKRDRELEAKEREERRGPPSSDDDVPF